MEVRSGEILKTETTKILARFNMEVREKFGLSNWKNGVAFNPDRKNFRGAGLWRKNQASHFGQDKFEVLVNIQVESLTRLLIILAWSSGEKLGWRCTFASHQWVDSTESHKSEQNAQGSV